MRKIDFAKEDYGDEEKDAVNKILDRGWLANGSMIEEAEKNFAQYIGKKHAIFCNSGSSANLLAITCLKIIERIDCVLTSACGFPATLNPILHNNLRPLFADYDLKTHNINIEQCKIQDTRYAIIFAHTMGFPVMAKELIEWCKEHKVPVVEDCCESVGAEYYGVKTGSLGDISTFSFYPSHQITAFGGGGMVCTDNEEYANVMRSLRGWGKMWRNEFRLGDSKTKFTSMVDDIPYYAGYTYETIGYNFQGTEASAAFLIEQIKKIDAFSGIRLMNWCLLFGGLRGLPFETNERNEGCVPSPFGFIMTLQKGDRNKFIEYLEENGIRTRPFFAGNILRHSAYGTLSEFKDRFPVADHLMRHSLFIGCHTKLKMDDIKYMIEKVKAWMASQ